MENEKSNNELEKTKVENDKPESPTAKPKMIKKSKLVKSPSLDHRSGLKGQGHHRSNSSEEKPVAIKEQAMGEVSKKYW